MTIPPSSLPFRRGTAVLLLAFCCLAGTFALDRLDAHLPGVFDQKQPAPRPFTALCTYSVMNATVTEDGVISLEPKPDGSGWGLRMRAADMEITGSTSNGLLFEESRYTMSRPVLIQKWNYDTRTGLTQGNGQGYVMKGTLERKAKVNSSFAVAMGKAPLDSDFLGFQLGALLARGVGSFNADFLIKNRGMKVNADFVLSRADEAKIKGMLAESGPFATGLARILKPGCLVYTIRLTGVIGAFYQANIYAAFSDEPIPAFLGYWNTNRDDREGLWIKATDTTAN